MGISSNVENAYRERAYNAARSLHIETLAHLSTEIGHERPVSLCGRWGRGEVQQ